MLHNYTYCNARIAQHETNNSPKIKELLMCVCISHSNRKTATAAPITIREDDVVRWPTQCFKKRWVFQKAVTACELVAVCFTCVCALAAFSVGGRGCFAVHFDWVVTNGNCNSVPNLMRPLVPPGFLPLLASANGVIWLLDALSWSQLLI